MENKGHDTMSMGSSDMISKLSFVEFERNCGKITTWRKDFLAQTSEDVTFSVSLRFGCDINVYLILFYFTKHGRLFQRKKEIRPTVNNKRYGFVEN